MKINQIEKFDQRQKTAKWTQMLSAGLISRGSTDFSGLGAIFTKPFTNTVFAGNVFLSFNHLGTSYCSCYGLGKPLLQ
jgi:hypothetical protein